MGFSGTCIGAFLNFWWLVAVEGKFWYSSNLFVADKAQAILKSFDTQRFSEKKFSYASHLVSYMPQISDKPERTGGVWEYTLNGPLKR